VTQRRLFAADLGEGLVCAFGTAWSDHQTAVGCAQCDRAVAEAIARFQASVRRGDYMATGHKVARPRWDGRDPDPL
jgi:hypothetical protein